MLHRVKGKRNLKRVKRTFFPRPSVLAKSLLAHVRRHPLIYAPAVGPVVLVLLTHIIAVPAHILFKSSARINAMTLVDSILTWSVYGFLPLLLLSYGCFHGVARSVAQMLKQQWDNAPPAVIGLLPGIAYGAVAAMAFLILLRPGSEYIELAIFTVCLLIGMLNWFVYRLLSGNEAHRIDAANEPPGQ